MRAVIVATCLFSLFTLSSTAFANDRLKPGLWQMTVKSDMFKAMPKIPPEQMEQMRKMGIEIPHIQDGAMVTQMCVTKEMAQNEDAMLMQQNEMGCQSRNAQRSGNTYTVDIVCNSAQMKGEGRAKSTFNSNESFTSVSDFKGMMHGQSVNQRQETAGKWLGADCGSVKPVVPPPGKK